MRTLNGDPHKPLRDDVRLLGELLGDTLRACEGQELLDRVEKVRALAKRAHAGDPLAFEELADGLSDLPIASAVPIARAFAHFLTLANIAEQHHRVRRRRDYARDPGRHPQPGSCADAFARWRAGGLSPEALADAVRSMRIELVLTAHPTEIVRRTLLQSHRRIADVLAIRDRPDLTPEESDAAIDALRREMATVWQTDEVRDRAVSPLDEVRGGLAVFEQTLWEALPRYVRQIDRALGEPLPLDAAPLRFGSWIGGDRDGNPNVTPEVTRKATWMARWVAADLYARETSMRCERSSRSGSPATSCVQSSATRRTVPRAAARRRGAPPRDARLHGRRDRARGWSLERFRASVPGRGDFAAPLLLCHRSLVATGNGLIAAGRLTDILRRVAAFGLTLAPLDLRQDAARHTEAIAWIAEVVESRALRRRLRRGAHRDADPRDCRPVPERLPICRWPTARSPARFATCSKPSGPPPRCRPSRWAPTSSRWRAARQTCSPSSCCRSSPAIGIRSAWSRCSKRPSIFRARATSSTRCSGCPGIARGSPGTRK